MIPENRKKENREKLVAIITFCELKEMYITYNDFFIMRPCLVSGFSMLSTNSVLILIYEDVCVEADVSPVHSIYNWMTF